MGDLNKIVNYLKNHKDNLRDYNWNPKLDKLFELGIISSKDKQSLSSIKGFKKDELLKNILSGLLNSTGMRSKEFNKLALWIIHDWGGINFGSEEGTLEAVYDFLNSPKPKFERIASTSKVAAFMHPDKFIIYDSRVAYTINWIILSLKTGHKYFPIPEGRNSKMKAFDVNVLIHLENIEKFRSEIDEKSKNYIAEIDNELYISKTDAYYEMNKLIREANQLLWNDYRREEPFYTEMLLFSLADTVVFKEITHNVKINYKYNDGY